MGNEERLKLYEAGNKTTGETLGYYVGKSRSDVESQIRQNHPGLMEDPTYVFWEVDLPGFKITVEPLEKKVNSKG